MGICSEGETNPEGLGPAPNTNVAEKLTKPRKMKLYGNYFNSDTRTVMTLIKISGIEHEFQEVDIFLGKHKDIDYLAKNPCGTIPMLTDQDSQILGNISTFVNYLSTKPKLQSYMPRAHSAKIEQYINWHLSVLRPCIQRMIKVIVGPKAFGHEEYSGDEIEAAKSAFCKDILGRIEGMLNNQMFLISAQEPTAVDIIFYNEISTALMLTRIKWLEQRYPNIFEWITLMGTTIQELDAMDEILGEIVDKYILE